MTKADNDFLRIRDLTLLQLGQQAFTPCLPPQDGTQVVSITHHGEENLVMMRVWLAFFDPDILCEEKKITDDMWL